MEPELNFEDIVWACTNLCDLIEYENEALAAHDHATVAELQHNKQALARIYEQSVAPMAETPELADGLEPEQREELMALGSRLKDLVEENARRLKAEMVTHQRVMDAVVEAIKANSTAGSVQYNAGADLTPTGGSENSSLSFNKTL